MGTAFEISMVLSLHPELESRDAETLAYMTRSQNYDFQTLLDDPLFTSSEVETNLWRYVIANNRKQYAQESISQVRRSAFCNNQLCFRIMLGDDTYWDYGWEAFTDWLFSISTNEGLVGYVVDVTCFKTELIYFEKSGMTLRTVEDFKVPNSLISSINELLGGTGWVNIEPSA